MKYFEAFAGVGGIGIGLPKEWECVGFSEMDKYASQILAYHYGDLINDCSCGNLITCPLRFVRDVKNIESFIKTLLGVADVLPNTKEIDTEKILKSSKEPLENGEKPTMNSTDRFTETFLPESDDSYLISMEGNVLVVEKRLNNSLPSTTKITMDIRIEKSMVQEQCISLPLKEGFQILIKSSAITAIIPKGDTEYVHTKKYRKGVPNFGDISKIDWKQVPDFDMYTGGSPCQDFSIAGKRRGLAGAKSSLAWEYIRGLRIKKPRYFIWENVKGVMSSRGGWDFANILTAFSESGYALWWQVLNAKDFGVPQNRERIFVFGTRGDSTKEVFFERQDSKEADELQRQFSNTLTARYEKAQATETYIVTGELDAQKIKVLNKGESQHYRLYDEDGLAPTLQSQSGMSSQKHPFIRVTKDGYHMARNDKKKSSIQGTHVTFPKGKSHALSTAHIPMTQKENQVRKLMPIECERLMSWPETVFYVKMELCLDQAKNYVDVVRQNPKLLKLVGIAERQGKKSLADFVPSLQKTYFAQESAITVGKKVGKRKTQKSDSNVECAENLNHSNHRKSEDTSVPSNVSINIIVGETINGGLEVLQAKEGERILQFNGKDVLKLCGEEIMRLVEDVESDSAICHSKSFMYITLGDSRINPQDFMLIILYFYAISAIDGFIQGKISNESLSLIVRFSHGHTRYGSEGEISDSQRYKMCGNGVVSACIKAIVKSQLL